MSQAEAARGTISAAKLLVAQLEVPLEITLACMRIAREEVRSPPALVGPALLYCRQAAMLPRSGPCDPSFADVYTWVSRSFWRAGPALPPCRRVGPPSYQSARAKGTGGV